MFFNGTAARGELERYNVIIMEFEKFQLLFRRTLQKCRTKQVIEKYRLKLFLIKNYPETIYRKYIVISIRFQQNRRYIMLIQKKGAISIKIYRFLWNQSKITTFLNKNKGAISKITSIRLF